MVTLDKEYLDHLWQLYKGEGDMAITLNHYELAERTDEKNPEVWKAFLMDPDVANWIQTEINIVKQTELKKMVKGASKTRSVGQAQLINALAKASENDGIKEGPVFIYSYVPLNPQQEHANNARVLETNPFIRSDSDA